MRLARILVFVLALLFFAGLGATFAVTYREQTRTVHRLERERAALRRENRRLTASVASAQTALGTLGVALDATRGRVRATAEAGHNRDLEAYVGGYLSGGGLDPTGADDVLDAGSTTGYAH